jgi:hypothetical protein
MPPPDLPSAPRATIFSALSGNGRYSALASSQGARIQTSRCGEEVLRMSVTGGSPVRGGGGMSHRIAPSRARHRRSAPRAPGSRETRLTSAAGCRRGD